MLIGRRLLPLVLLTTLGPLHVGSSEAVSEGDVEYIDPFDMENFQPPSNIKSPPNPNKPDRVSPDDNEKSLPSTPPPEQPPTQNPQSGTTVSPASKPVKDDSATNCKPDAKSPSNVLFRNYVKHLLGKFHGKLPKSSSAEEFYLEVKLSAEDVDNLEIFASGQSRNMHDAHEILTSMLKGVSRSNVGTTEKLSSWFQDKFGLSMSEILKVLTMIALVFITMAAGINIRLTWRQFVLKAVILAFLISIPMTWYELYKAAEIQQQTVAMKDAPPECVKKREDMEDGIMDSWFGLVRSAFRGLFTFEKDNCQKYYEHMLINPFLKVPPTKAVAVTFVRFFVSPLKDVGEAIGEFLRALLIDLPLALYPVAIAAVTIFFFLFLFMWMGYSIRLPFFLSIEPGPQAVVGGDSGAKEAIEDRAKDLQDQMKAIQDTLVSQEEKLLDRMVHMEKVQMAALEYGAMYQQGSGDSQPPTLPPVQRHPAPPHMSLEPPDHDIEKSSSSVSSAVSIDDHCPHIQNVNLTAAIPCSENSQSWTDIETDIQTPVDHTEVALDHGEVCNDGDGQTQQANEVVTLIPASVVISEQSP